MKALNFVIGMIVGMILLVVAVVGVIFAAGSLVNVGQLENTLGTDIFDDESSVNDKTLLELVQALIKDFGNMDGVTINKLRNEYGLKIPTELSGIDISVLFDYPITDVPNHLGDIVNNMTLRDVGEFLEMDFESYELPVIDDNLDNYVNVALDNILSSIDDETMTIYSIGRDFGLSLGENNLIATLKHTPLNAFASVMDNLPIGIVADADSDLFLVQGENTVYVCVDRFEEVVGDEIASSDVSDGAETYIASADDNGLVYRELRYVESADGTFVVDNSCYSSSFNPSSNEKTFYRHVVYEEYSSDAAYGADTKLVAEALLNCFVADGNGGFVLSSGGMISLDDIYVDEALSVSVADAILSGEIPVANGKFDLSSAALYIAADNGEGGSVASAATLYGLADGVIPDGDTRLDDRYDGYFRVHVGTADPAIQVIAGETLSSVAGATDKITSLKLGEVLDIDENSAKILRTLADTPINEMSAALDSITLSDATDIVLSEYTENDLGAYVLTEEGYYTLYNPSNPAHAGLQRFDRTSVDGESSAALQRLAHVKIPDISSAFSGMVLGDALNVDTDTFAAVDEAALVDGETYFVFNEQFGYPERVVYFAADYVGVNPPAFYERTSKGESNSVLKQLAFVNVDDVSFAMDEIIENTLLSDIIDVAEFSIVREDAEGDMWVMEYNPYFTEGEGENATYYTYVYNGKGSYYLSDELFLAATESQLTGATAVRFDYVQNSGISSVRDILALGGNVYFRSGSDGNFVFETNPALLANYVVKLYGGDSSALTALQNTFSRVENADGAYEATVYTNTDVSSANGLYVVNNGSFSSDGGSVNLQFGSYVRYDAANPAHWGETLYFRYTDGYYPASADPAIDGETRYSFSYSEGFVADADGEYVKLPAKTDGARENLYYYKAIDSGYVSGYTVFSKRECDVIYIESASGAYVCVADEYVLYDENNELHQGLTRYDRLLGYLGNDAANTGGTGLPALSDLQVGIVEEKSPTILIALLDRQITVGGMNEAIDVLTLEELMEIEEGSVFDSELLRTSTIENLSENASRMFTEMTIGELLKYANISVSSEVSYILQDVMLADFFGALEYSDGAITVNMTKLFGY